MKLLVDARVGWGHGIGRVIANTLPRVAKLLPDWRMEALVLPDQIAAADAVFADAPNLVATPCPIRPFSLNEQRALQAYGRNHDLTWFTNYWVPLAWRGKFVVTVHDMLHLVPEYFLASRVRRALSRRTFAKVRRDAAAVMFVSRFTQQAFTQMIGTPRNGVTVTLGGDHLDYGRPKTLRERSRRLLVVAASKQHKNFPRLFEAWSRAQVPEHWTLTVISPQDMLRSSVDLTGLAAGGRRVDVRRSVTNAELAALYADTAILLMPSLYEGFGLPLLEGLLAGALCISSNAGAMVEVAEGTFVQFVNGTDLDGWIRAIEDCCSLVDDGAIDLDPVLRLNVDRARRLRWDRTAEETVAVLRQAAGD